MNKTEKELDYRYRVCDEKHLKPDHINNECNYCYRRLEYDKLQPDSNFGIRELHRFENGNEREHWIEIQKEEDRNRGLDILYRGYEIQENIKECLKGLVGKVKFWN